MDYKELYGSESYGAYGGVGIKILVAASQMPDLDEEAIYIAASKAARLVSSEVQAAIVAMDGTAQERAKQERQQLVDLFLTPVFAEEIPNGYCSDWCCRHLPWLVVTTKVGRFKIGWRKRVIEIDWSDTVGTKQSGELFPEENVTKGEKYIHAWSLDDARKYIAAIIG